MASQHRLRPMLHWQLGQAHQSLRLPTDVTAALTATWRASAVRSLKLQRELLLTHQILADAGIRHMALKGAALAWHAYPHPALRPMRDLDILVPADDALRAFDTLLKAGLSRTPSSRGHPAAMLQWHRHLPALRSPSGTVTVELHSRLSGHGQEGTRTVDVSHSDSFWARGTTLPMAGASLPVTSPTDLLLHLIVHAVYDHEFNNGPVLLGDLAFLLDRQAIDWHLFWVLAEQGGHTRGCVLALSVMQLYWGAQPIDWQGNEPSPEDGSAAQADLAAHLMLRDFDARFDVSLQASLTEEPGQIQGIRHLLRKLFRPRLEVAAAYPVSQHDPRVFLWYPVLWCRLAFERTPTFLRSRRRSGQHEEAGRLLALRQWLHAAAPHEP